MRQPSDRLETPSSRPGSGPGPGAEPSPSARKIWVDLLLYPTHSLPTAVAPVLVGLGLAARDRVLAPIPVLVAFVGSWAIHVAGVFADNHELLRLHPGLPEHPELTRAVEEGRLRLSVLAAATLGLVGLAILTAPYLYGIGGAPVLWMGALGIVASVSYNAGPWAYVRRGVATEPIFLIMFGVVGEVGTYYIQAAAVHGAPAPWHLLWSLPPAVYLAGLPAGALVTSVMLIDDMRDHEFDSAKGWRTSAVRRGPSFTRDLITSLVAFAFLAPLALWAAPGFDAWVLLPLVSAPLGYRTVRGVRAARRRSDLIPMTPRMARLAAVYSALLALGIALCR